MFPLSLIRNLEFVKFADTLIIAPFISSIRPMKLESRVIVMYMDMDNDRV